MATSEELHGFTIEKLREMCAERHIAIHTRKKEELIAALMEVVPEAKDPGVQGGVPTGPSTGELFELYNPENAAGADGLDAGPAATPGAVDGSSARVPERVNGENE